MKIEPKQESSLLYSSHNFRSEIIPWETGTFIQIKNIIGIFIKFSHHCYYMWQPKTEGIFLQSRTRKSTKSCLTHLPTTKLSKWCMFHCTWMLCLTSFTELTLQMSKSPPSRGRHLLETCSKEYSMMGGSTQISGRKFSRPTDIISNMLSKLQCKTLNPNPVTVAS
jgi:hypothetical protein